MTKLLSGITVLAVAGAVCIGGFIGFSASKNTCQPVDDDIRPPASTGRSATGGLSKEQLKNADVIIGVAKSRGRSKKDTKVALMVARQESGMRNISYGDRDSLGLFQQRAGWGTVKQRLDPIYATNAFFKELEKIKNRADKSLLAIALAVQRPSRAAYLSPHNNFNWWGKMADALLANYSGSKSTSPPITYDECGETDEGGDGGDGSWRKPLDGTMRIGSPWGQRYHPILHYWRLHDGIDLSASRGQHIYSVGTGKVVFRGYNSGAGNYVRVDYGNGYVVSYLHMSRFGSFRVGDRVKAGDILGYVGSTGLSTAPHLHLGLKKNNKGIDPVPWLCGKKINIPGPKGCAKLN